MRRTAFTIVLLCLVQVLQAQMTGAYMKLGTGYAFGLGAQTADNSGIPYSGNLSYLKYNYPMVSSYDMTKVSFSAGVQVYICGGYMFNEHIGAELNLQLMPAPSSYDVYLYNTYNPVGSDVVNGHFIRQMSMPFLASPMLVYSTGGKMPFSYYAKGGLVLPVYTKMTVDQQYYNPITGADEEVKEETKMKFGVGFSGAMGIRYNFSPQLSFWTECYIMALSLYPSETTVTEHTVNGDPAASNRAPLVGSVIKYNTTAAYSSNSLPEYALPFSHISFNLGVMYYLNKEKASQSIRRR